MKIPTKSTKPKRKTRLISASLLKKIIADNKLVALFKWSPNEERVIVSKVSTDKDSDYYSIQTKQGIGFAFEKKYKVVPKSGDIMTLYTKGFSMIRGVDINNVQIYYKSDEDLERERQEWLVNNEKEKQERFEKCKAELDAKYEALPQVFKARIDRFRENNPDFRKDYEQYEMFCCEQAIEIATALKTADAVRLFWDKTWEEQKAEVPTIDEGHSGNTFGASCSLAIVYIESPEFVSKVHGALSPLVGSVEYGDIKNKSKESLIEEIQEIN